MKIKILILCLLLLLFSCKESSTKEKKSNVPIQNNSQINTNEKSGFLEESKPELNKWKDFYTKLDPDFSVEKFEKTDSYKLEPMEGSVQGVFEEDFDPVYSDFLIYNSKKDKYIDIDSYSWILDGNEILFEADQEVNVVDIPTKTITRIAFMGPSYWVEDAYWKDDFTVVLLENNDERIPMVAEINLKTNQVVRYAYKDTLKVDSDYTNQRIQGKIKK